MIRLMIRCEYFQLAVGCCIFLLSTGLNNAVAQNPTTVSQTRSTLKEWVLAEKTLSREAADWQQEKVLLQDLLAVLDQEIKTLKTEIASSQESLSQADEEREKLLKVRAESRDQREMIQAYLADLEPRLLLLRSRLPEPLDNQLAIFFNRIPEEGTPSSLGIAERAQTVLGILDAIRAFDNKLTVARELRQGKSGSTQEMTTLYLGLGQAFYVSAEDAGIGYPQTSSWQWESKPVLRQAILSAIAMAEGKTHEVDYIALPLKVSK